MRTLKKAIVLAFLINHSLTTYVNAGIILPEPDCGIDAGDTCLVFDDFTVFSMSFLQFGVDGSLAPNSGDLYYIDSSPGKIADDIVIASSPAVSRNNSDVTPFNPNDIDNAFDTPNAGGSDTFVMLESAEPSPVLTNDNIASGQPGSALPNPDGINIDGDNGNVIEGDGNQGGGVSLWDIETAALTTFLGGDDLLFFFNLNETGANDELDSGQDMLGWMRVYLTNSTTGAIKQFTLSGNNTLFPSIQSQAQNSSDSILPTPDDLWAYIHGEICVSSLDASVLALSSCSAAGNPANGVTVNQNLGANSAAFGLWNQELNDAVYSGDYDLMSVDLRMAHIENGYEQLFIRAANVSGDRKEIPEPATIMMLLIGIVLLNLNTNRAALIH